MEVGGLWPVVEEISAGPVTVLAPGSLQLEYGISICLKKTNIRQDFSPPTENSMSFVNDSFRIGRRAMSYLPNCSSKRIPSCVKHQIAQEASR